ncbi:MAG: hypothetical protein FJ293_14530 [Planctomycetes bacterium]|nr:hypothetical protein [Planctomycetota bacterium]
MTAVLLPLLTSAAAAWAPPTQSPVSDLLLAPSRVEASREASGEAFEPIVVDGSAGTTPWRRARVTFTVPEDRARGVWLLGIGAPGLDVEARLAGVALGSAPDALASDVRVRFGPRFTVGSDALPAGSATFELAFPAAAGATGLERGPLWLAAPGVAQRAFEGAQSSDQEFGPANFAAAATVAPAEGAALERICFKWSDRADALEASAQLDFAVVDRERGGELPARSLTRRRAGAVFPTSFATFEDGRLRSFQTQIAATAGIATSPLRLSDAKVITFELSQTALRQAFQHFWNVRFLPGIGGPLRVTREKGLILLANERIGLAANVGRPIGDPAAPCGLEVELSSIGGTGPENTPGASRPSIVRLAVIGFEPGGADPSQADSLLDLARSAIQDWTEHQTDETLLASSIVTEPSLGAATTGLGTRKAALATLLGTRRRGTRFLFAPDGCASGPAAFWGDSFTLLHFRNHERGAIERLLASQEEDGTVRLDLALDAGDAEVAAVAAYAVLRACRWARWTADGDRFGRFVAGLDRALARADGCDLAPGPAQRDVTPLHAALVRAAAHLELADALESLGLDAASAARHREEGERQRETLLGDGGRLDPEGFAELTGGFERDAALALALGLCDDRCSAAIATQVAPGTRKLDPADWRDAVVARGLLASGRLKALGGFVDGLDNGWRTLARPEGAGIAAWHGVVLFGLLGARRSDLGTLELRPRLPDRHFIRSAIRIPEGVVRFQISVTDERFERQVIATNESTSDLLIRVGLPNGADADRRRTVGEAIHAYHEEVLAPRATWRTRLR